MSAELKCSYVRPDCWGLWEALWPNPMKLVCRLLWLVVSSSKFGSKFRLISLDTMEIKPATRNTSCRKDDFISAASALSKKIGKMRSLRDLFPLPYWNLKIHRLSSRDPACERSGNQPNGGVEGQSIWCWTCHTGFNFIWFGGSTGTFWMLNISTMKSCSKYLGINTISKLTAIKNMRYQIHTKTDQSFRCQSLIIVIWLEWIGVSNWNNVVVIPLRWDILWFWND